MGMKYPDRVQRSGDQSNLTAENPKGAEMKGILFACSAFFAVMIL